MEVLLYPKSNRAAHELAVWAMRVKFSDSLFESNLCVAVKVVAAYRDHSLEDHSSA